jgi:hypothetical protein
MPLVLSGATSGSATLQSTDATTTTITLPGTTSTLYGNAGTVITSGTAVASTSGTAIGFTGIPSWVKRITVMFSGVSTTGTSPIQVQIGSTTYTTTGYVSTGSDVASTVATTTITTGYAIASSNAAAYAFSGNLIINNVTSNTWVASGSFSQTTSRATFSGGTLALGGVLDRVQVTTVNGTDTFDAGSINIQYE